MLQHVSHKWLNIGVLNSSIDICFFLNCDMFCSSVPSCPSTSRVQVRRVIYSTDPIEEEDEEEGEIFENFLFEFHLLLVWREMGVVSMLVVHIQIIIVDLCFIASS